MSAPKVYPPLTGSARALGTLALSTATFMNVLDTSIANVSLPAISGDLGVSTVQGTWVITSFAAYFSDRGRLFQADRGRRIGVAVAALGKRAGTGVNVS